MNFLSKITSPKLGTVAIWICIHYLLMTATMFLYISESTSLAIILVGAFLVIGLISKTRGFKIGNGILCVAYLALLIYAQSPSETSSLSNLLNIFIILVLLQVITASYVVYVTLISKHVAILYNNKGDVSVFRKMLFKVFLGIFVVVVIIVGLNDLQIMGFI